MKTVLYILAAINCLMFTIIEIFQLTLFTLIFLPLYFVFNSKDIRTYIMNNYLGYDQMMNAIWLGDCDETISSRLGKSESKAGRLFVKIVDFLFGKNHCSNSIEKDEGYNGLL